jgi:hypothetical protein
MKPEKIPYLPPMKPEKIPYPPIKPEKVPYAPIKPETKYKVQKPKIPELPWLPRGDEKPQGGDAGQRTRLGIQKISQPIATGMQLLSGKGLFNIKYNVKTPSSLLATTGRVFTKSAPTHVSEQFTSNKMGLGKFKSSETSAMGKAFTKSTQNQAINKVIKPNVKVGTENVKSSESLVFGKTTIGANIGNMVNSMKVAARSPVKTKINLKRRGVHK